MFARHHCRRLLSSGVESYHEVWPKFARHRCHCGLSSVGVKPYRARCVVKCSHVIAVIASDCRGSDPLLLLLSTRGQCSHVIAVTTCCPRGRTLPCTTCGQCPHVISVLACVCWGSGPFATTVARCVVNVSTSSLSSLVIVEDRILLLL